MLSASRTIFKNCCYFISFHIPDFYQNFRLDITLAVSGRNYMGKVNKRFRIGGAAGKGKSNKGYQGIIEGWVMFGMFI